MYHGGREEVRSGPGTPRRSIDGYRVGPSMRGSWPGTPRSESAMAYPTYVNPPASISGATDMDYDYDERDLGLTQQARPLSGRISESSRSGPRSHRSAPAAMPNRGYSWDPSMGHLVSPPGYLPGQQYANVHSSEALPGAWPEFRKEAAPQDNTAYWYAGPPSSSHSSHGYFPVTPLSHDADPTLFGISAPHHHPGHHQTRQEEVLPNFPHWSRTWYDGHLSANGHAYTGLQPPHSGQSGWESETLSRPGAAPGPYGSAYGHPSMTDSVKEERMRMLEKEFGKPRVTHKGAKGRDDDDEDVEADLGEDDDFTLGSVSSTGRLITERPKWNLALRSLQGLISLIACACGLGGVLFVKTTSTDQPAPKGTFAAYILYACSIITLIALLYFHIFRALCCDPMRKEVQSGPDSSNPLGGMIIPILTGGGAGGKMPKQKKFGKRMQQSQAPTVNLIVDPSLLDAMGGGRGKRDRDESDDDERLPGDARRSSKRKNGLGVFGNMQMQRRWQLARRRVKLLTTLDVVLCILWIATDVVSLGLGKKCPASSEGMWCTLYNITMACGVILAILFAAGIYFDYRDLKVSRNAPRPPM